MVKKYRVSPPKKTPKQTLRHPKKDPHIWMYSTTKQTTLGQVFMGQWNINMGHLIVTTMMMI